jgi:hypothetical protein
MLYTTDNKLMENAIRPVAIGRKNYCCLDRMTALVELQCFTPFWVLQNQEISSDQMITPIVAIIAILGSYFYILRTIRRTMLPSIFLLEVQIEYEVL